MPNPKQAPVKPVFNFNSSDTKNNMVSSMTHNKQAQYQWSGTFLFQYNKDTNELRDNDFNKHSTKVMDVKDATDLLQYYKQLQSM
jgi:hypothetical protein